MNIPSRIASLLAASLAAGSLLIATPVLAQAHSDKEKKEDIARHRTIAAAHENAARCLESGKSEDACYKDLLAACKGIAIGKYCGMRHGH